MNDIDLGNVNLIDTECNFYDDDDFGGSQVKLKESNFNVQKNDIIKQFPLDSTPNRIDEGAYNQIDMECNVAEDDDDFVCENRKKDNYVQEKGFFADFSDDDDFDNKELVDEEVLEEKNKKKKKVTSGEVEADYWEKMAKQHASTNKKGARGWFELFPAGDPKRNAELFNHAMGSDKYAADGSSSNASLFAAGDVAGNTSTGNIGSSDAGDSGDAGAGDGGCCENLQESNDAASLEELLNLFGLQLIPNKEASEATLKDIYEINPDVKVQDKVQLKDLLQPYINEFIIYPLQIETGILNNTCEDWCNWYTPEIAKQYPKCSKDIKYCDMIVKIL